MSGTRAVEDFVGAAEEWQQELAAALDRLAADPASAEQLAAASRAAGRIGEADVLGFTRLARLAGRIRDLLRSAGELPTGATPPVLDALGAGSDAIGEIVAAIGRGEGEGGVDDAGVLEDLDRVAPPSARPAAPPAVPPAAPSTAPVDEVPGAGPGEPVPDARLLAAFIEDAEDRSQKLSTLVAGLEPGAITAEVIHETFRAAHDLKSASATAGFHRMARLAHRMEDVLHRVRDGALELDQPVRDALLEGADRIAEMVAAIGRDAPEASVDVAAAVAALSVFAPPTAEAAPATAAVAGAAAPRPAFTERDFGASERARVREAGDRGEALFRLVVDLDPEEQMRFARAYLLYAGLEDAVNVVAVDPPMDPSLMEPDDRGDVADDRAYARVTVWFTSPGDGSEALAAAAGTGTARVERLDAGAVAAADRPPVPAGDRAAEPAGTGRRPGTERATIRVDTRKLDTLWTQVAELVQAKARIGTVADRLGRGEDVEGQRAALSEALDSLDKISGGMQQAMMETRMIPIRVIFEKLPRLVRDLSRKLHKAVDLETAGEDTEIDRGIVEALADPLQHLLRNAVDHGVEYPEDRVRHGKTERGRVRLAASQQGGRIVIEVSDDGRGIDLDKVRAKAVAQGIDGAAAMGERELLELIFRPGFSTRADVSDVSGRGVGMDVVATSIRGDLKGEVLLASRPGSGTHVTLLLPLTLTIMRALLVRGESHVFAIPLAGVETTTRVLNTEIRGTGDRQTCAWQEAEIPLFTLGGLLGRSWRRADEHAAVVLRRGGSRACLLVDELLEEREIVIKPLDDLANHRRLFSGVSVREDGTLVFILDTSFVPPGS